MTGKRTLTAGLLAAAVLGLGLVSASAQMGPGGRGPGMMRGGGMMGNGPGGNGIVRRRAFMANGLPAQYAHLANPLPTSPATVASGRALYDDNCAACHGPRGRGDGAAGKALNPPPSDLMALIRMPMASDGYLFWAISDGGEKLGTAMPAFKDALSADKRWAIIAALRAGLPPAK